MNPRISIKTAIKELSSKKFELTRSRCKYKVESRGVVAEPDRLAWFGATDADRSSLKHQIRSALLAYAFVRGKTYVSQERFTKDPPDSMWIYYVLEGHGLTVDVNKIGEWLMASEETAKAAE